VFEFTEEHRHPEKNIAIMQLSAKLGLSAAGIALLQIKKVAPPEKSTPGFILFKVMMLSTAYTKGAEAMGRSVPKYVRRTVSFSVEAFDRSSRRFLTWRTPV
jgi:hypothetical protein